MNEHAALGDDDLLELLPVGALSIEARPGRTAVLLRANAEARRLLGEAAPGAPLADLLGVEAAGLLSAAAASAAAEGSARVALTARGRRLEARLRRGASAGRVVAALSETAQPSEAEGFDETRYEAAAAALGVGVFEYCFRRDALRWDVGMLALYGLPPDRAPRCYADWLALLAPGEAARHAERAPERDGKDLVEDEFDILLPDGRRRRLRARIRIVQRDAAGAPLRAFGVNSDVTELHRAELAERRFAEAIEALPDAFALYDAEDRLLAINEAARRHAPGFHATARVGDRFEDILRCSVEQGAWSTEGDAESWIAARLATHRAADGRRFEIVSASGSVVRVVERRLADGATVTVGVDVTEEREAQRRAADAERRFREAADSLVDGFVIYDAEDRLVYANRRYRELYAESAPSMVEGARFEDVIRYGVAQGQYPAARGREEAWIAERLAIHRELPGPIEQALPGGRWLRIVERRTESGDTVGLRVDITDLKRQQSELRAAKNAAEEAFARLAATSATLESANHRLAMTAEMSGAGAWEYDPRSGQVWWDPIKKRIAGVPETFQPSLEEAVAFYAEEERETIREAVRACVERAEPFDLELVFVAADGARKWCRAIGRAVSEGPAPHRIAGVFQDVTKRHRREAQNERLRARFQAIVDGAHAHVFLKRADGRFVDANPAFLASRGLSTVSDLSDHDFFDAERCAAFAATDSRVFETGERVVVEETVSVGGRTRSFLSSKFLIPDAETGEPLLCCVATEITEQKRREQEAERARDRFERMFEQSQVLAFVKDRKGRYLQANRRYLAFLGVEAVEGLSTADVLPRDVADDIDRRYARVFETGSPEESVETFVHQGRRRRFVLSKFLIPHLREDDVALCCVAVEITAQMEREEEVERARDRFQRIFDNTASPMFVKNRAGRLVMANLTYRRLHRIARLDGVNEADLHDPGHAALYARNDARVFDTGEPFAGEETALIDGELRFFLVSKFLIPDPDDEGDAALCCVATEITEQRARETEIAQVRARFEAVFEGSDALMFIKRRDGVFIAANRRFVEETGGAPLVGLNDAAFRSAEGGTDVNANDAKVFESGEPFLGEETVIRPGGRRRTYLSSKFLLPDPLLGEDVLCAICTDVTEIKRLQTEAEESRRAAEEANLAKSQFLATMSHEIRTPMNGVIGMAELLGRTSLDGRQREMLDVIRESGALLLNVINDILDFSKIEAGRIELENAPFQPCGVARRVEAIHANRALEKGVDFAVSCGEGAEAPRLGDALRLEQIMHNLVSNAIKFAEGGAVRVSVTGGEGRPLTIEVADDGIGMDAAQAARVFDRFAQADSSTTRRFGGTGLGLSIVKGLVERMDGEIALDSAPGRGARFTVTLPLAVADGAPDRAGSPATAAAVGLDGMEVLAADDNEINRTVLSALAESAGARCRACAGGAEAIEAASERAWDALLIDLSMPGMDGFATLDGIRSAERAAGRAAAPAIAFSASADPEDVAECLARGFDAHLAKPLRRDRLIEVLRSTARGAPALANPGESD